MSGDQWSRLRITAELYSIMKQAVIPMDYTRDWNGLWEFLADHYGLSVVEDTTFRCYDVLCRGVTVASISQSDVEADPVRSTQAFLLAIDFGEDCK